MHNNKFAKLFFVSAIITIFLASCGSDLSEGRATELVNLNYKQQNTMEGAGTWLIDSVIIHSISRIEDDTAGGYRVVAYINGLYKLPVIEDAPQGYTESFFDTLQFVARKTPNNVWMADDWTIIGSRHE